MHVYLIDVRYLFFFLNRTPLSMAVWSLTCFFISASSNKWIRALYPNLGAKSSNECNSRHFVFYFSWSVTLLNFVTLVFRLVLLKRGKRPGTVYLCWNIVLLSLILNGNFSFSYIVGRMGKLEDIDVRIFCAAAMDFYRTQVKQVVAASWVSYKLCFPFGLYGVFHNFVTFFFLNEEKKKHFILDCSVVEALQVNNPCLQFLHIHGQFHKPESFPLLFMTFFRGRGKEGSWFGVVGRRGGGG